MNTSNSLYNSKEYKHFLRIRLATNDPFSVTQAAMAKAAGCKASYLSQCLNGTVHLLPEQLHAIGVFLKMNEEDIEFLSLLLEHERSGSATHRAFLKRRISRLRQENERISVRLERGGGPVPGKLSETLQYYIDWYTTAVHILCTLPNIQTIEEIALKLGLTLPEARRAISILEQLGLVVHREGRFTSTSHHIHVGDQDPMLNRHHANWRLRSALRALPPPNHDLHYTAVYSLSRQDAAEIREDLTRMLLKVREKVRPSAEECVVAFGIDWFRLANSD